MEGETCYNGVPVVQDIEMVPFQPDIGNFDVPEVPGGVTGVNLTAAVESSQIVAIHAPQGEFPSRTLKCSIANRDDELIDEFMMKLGGLPPIPGVWWLFFTDYPYGRGKMLTITGDASGLTFKFLPLTPLLNASILIDSTSTYNCYSALLVPESTATMKLVLLEFYTYESKLALRRKLDPDAYHYGITQPFIFRTGYPVDDPIKVLRERLRVAAEEAMTLEQLNVAYPPSNLQQFRNKFEAYQRNSPKRLDSTVQSYRIFKILGNKVYFARDGKVFGKDINKSHQWQRDMSKFLGEGWANMMYKARKRDSRRGGGMGCVRR